MADELLELCQKAVREREGKLIPGEPRKVLPSVSIDILGIVHQMGCKLGLLQCLAIQGA